MFRSDRGALLAFVVVVLIGGSNFVAVRFSNRELAPFWGAGFRFAVAAALLFAFAAMRRIPFPPRDTWPSIAIFGIVNFGLTYAFAYWGLLEAPAAVGAALIALVPLFTFFIAMAFALEEFRWGGLVGALVSVLGVGIIFGDQLRFDVPLPSLIALILNPMGIALGTVLLKRMPRTHPIATNAVAMIPGALFLLVLAAIFGEHPTLPTRPEVLGAFLYVVTIGSVGLFGAIVYLLQHWSASATAYTTVLFPVVTVALGSALAGESVTVAFLLGTALVMVGTYIGALARPTAPARTEERAA